MMGDLCTHLTEYSAIFDQKNGVTPMPHPPYLTQSTFFVVSPDEKSPQKEMFCQCRRDETKNSRNTKRHQNRQVQTVLSKRKNVLVGGLHQIDITLKATEV